MIFDDSGSNRKTSKVGEAVYDILSKPQPQVEVGEIISEYASDYTKHVQEAVEKGAEQYQAPFYIVVLHKKEQWALNVIRNWFISRQTKPTAPAMWERFPNFMHTVYEYDGYNLNLLWSLPSPQEARVILQNWDLYDPQLVEWVKDAFAGLGLLAAVQ